LDPVNGGANVDLAQLKAGTVPVIESSIITSFETFVTDVHRAGQQLSGYFNPPATGNYRFHMACDDSCYLELDTTPFDFNNIVAPTYTEIASRNIASAWRENFAENDPNETQKPKSDWFFLVEGQLYPMRAFHIEYTGDDHISVGMEFEEADSSASLDASKTVQKFEITQTNVAEEWKVTVWNPDQGCYVLMMINLDDGTNPILWDSDCISSSASAATFKNAVKAYFSNYFSSDIEVTREATYSTFDPTVVSKYEYTIKLLKRINGQSFHMIYTTLHGTFSGVYAFPPSVLSSAPLGGKFKIRC